MDDRRSDKTTGNGHPRGRAATSRLIRTERIEVVDSSGRLRALVGEQRGIGPNHLPVFGLCIFGPNGSARACLIEDASGAALSFLQSGNSVLQLGVSDFQTLVFDDGEDLIYLPWDDADSEGPTNPGPYVVGCGPDGAPAIGWQVGIDRAVTLYMDDDTLSDDDM